MRHCTDDMLALHGYASALEGALADTDQSSVSISACLPCMKACHVTQMNALQYLHVEALSDSLPKL